MIIDAIAFILVVLGALIGWRRRLSGELSHLISVIVAFIVGTLAYRPLGQWLLEHSRLGMQAAHAVAFISAILVATIAMVMVRLVLRRIMSVVIEEEADKIGGAIAGFLRAVLFVIIIFLIMNMIEHDYLNRKFGEDSLIGRQVVRFMPRLEEKIEEKLEEISDQ